MIRRGEDWGTIDELPPSASRVESDSELAELVTSARRSGTDIGPVLLAGGDLAGTLGVRPGPTATGTKPRVRLDIGSALVDGRQYWFVAHLVARRRWWRGRAVVVANAAFLGTWNVAPRAHPGDGRLDVLDGRLTLGDRMRARRRLAAGTHIPHPAIQTRQTVAEQFDLAPALDVWLDGTRVGRASSLSVRVEPAAVEAWLGP